MRLRTTGAAACAAVLAIAALAGCNRGSDTAGGRIGIDLPRTDTDFWNSYQQYLEKDLDHGARPRCRCPTRRTTSPRSSPMCRH